MQFVVSPISIILPYLFLIANLAAQWKALHPSCVVIASLLSMFSASAGGGLSGYQSQGSIDRLIDLLIDLLIGLLIFLINNLLIDMIDG